METRSETASSTCAASQGKRSATDTTQPRAQLLKVVVAACIIVLFTLLPVVIILCTRTSHAPSGGGRAGDGGADDGGAGDGGADDGGADDGGADDGGADDSGTLPKVPSLRGSRPTIDTVGSLWGQDSQFGTERGPGHPSQPHDHQQSSWPSLVPGSELGPFPTVQEDESSDGDTQEPSDGLGSDVGWDEQNVASRSRIKVPSSCIPMTRTTTAPSTTDQCYHLPDLNFIFILHGPSNQPAGHTPLYDPNPERTFALVIAGTTNLGITGGGINGAAANMLVQQSHGTFDHLDLQRQTEWLHKEPVEIATKSPGSLCEHVPKKNFLYERMFAYCSFLTSPLPDVDPTVGVLIIGVLKPQLYIHGNPRNKYLLYIVSPKGTVPDPAFLVAYRHTWTSLVKGVLRFNELSGALKLDPIEQVRVPLLSGGIYAGKRDPRMLATMAVDTLLQCVREERPSFLMDFMYDSTESFFQAIKRHSA